MTAECKYCGVVLARDECHITLEPSARGWRAFHNAPRFPLHRGTFPSFQGMLDGLAGKVPLDARPIAIETTELGGSDGET